MPRKGATKKPTVSKKNVAGNAPSSALADIKLNKCEQHFSLNENKEELGSLERLLALTQFLPVLPQNQGGSLEHSIPCPMRLDQKLEDELSMNVKSLLGGLSEELVLSKEVSFCRILKVDWCLLNGVLRDEAFELIRVLVSCNNVLSNSLMKSIFKCFSRLIGEELTEDSNEVEENNFKIAEMCKNHLIGKECRYFSNMHLLLSIILKTVPLHHEALVDCVRASFPNRFRPVKEQVLYIKNVLTLCDLYPVHRFNLLLIIIMQLVEIDSQSSVCDFLPDTETERIAANEEFLPNIDHQICDPSDSAGKISFMFPLLQDYVCELIEQNEANKFYTSLLKPEISNLLMRCHKTIHTQFIWFIIAANSAEIQKDFLLSLWNYFKTSSDIISVTAIHYLGSYLARCNSVSIQTCLEWLDMLTKWAFDYVHSGNYQKSDVATKHLSGVSWVEDKGASLKDLKHLPYYAVCHIIFYLYAFRAKEIMSCQDGKKWVNKSGIFNLVYSHLNPLRYSSTGVVKIFTQVCRHFNVAALETVVIENERRGEERKLDLEKIYPIVEFFPFEYFLLRTNCEKVKCYIRDFENVIDVSDLMFDEADERTKEQLALDFIGDYSSDDDEVEKNNVVYRPAKQLRI